MASHFEDLISQGRGRPFEIEHIWVDKYDRFTDWFPHPSDFETERNRIGGLVLLQRGIDQSLNDAPYEDRRTAAAHGANLLARSLHPMAYQNNPAFAAFTDRTGLQFQPNDVFGPEQQQERQEFYIRIAERVWNPSRLDLDGEKPPVHAPIGVHGNGEGGSDDGATPRPGELIPFWTRLLDSANQKLDLHARISPKQDNWLSSHRHGIAWCYSVKEHRFAS